MKTNKINTKNEFELDENSEREQSAIKGKMSDEDNSKRLDGVSFFYLILK